MLLASKKLNCIYCQILKSRRSQVELLIYNYRFRILIKNINLQKAFYN